jgi:hypothetical protein
MNDFKAFVVNPHRVVGPGFAHPYCSCGSHIEPDLSKVMNMLTVAMEASTVLDAHTGALHVIALFPVSFLYRDQLFWQEHSAMRLGSDHGFTTTVLSWSRWVQETETQVPGSILAAIGHALGHCP